MSRASFGGTSRSAAFDPVRARRLAQQDRRLRRLHGDPAERPATGRAARRSRREAARGADIRAHLVDPSVELLEDLVAERAVALDHVVVVELVGLVRPGLGRDLRRARPHPRDQRGVIPSGLGKRSTSAPNARIVAIFSSAKASELTRRSG